MAISQSPRKKYGSRRKRQKSTPLYREGNVVRIRRSKFNDIRANDDFISMIRIGRVLNALNFTMQLIIENKTIDSAVGRRNHYRTNFNAGGFLYEGLLLVDDLRSKYANDDSFTILRDLPFKTSDRRRKIVKTIRDNVAFHFDHKNNTVRPTLENLNTDYFEFYSADGPQLGQFYFNLSDLIDINYILDELNDDKPERETHVEIYQVIDDLTAHFVRGAEAFIIGMSRKLGLVPQSGGQLARTTVPEP